MNHIQQQRHLTDREWISEFRRLGAFWKHDGNPRRPHALLTSGGHSNGFFNWSMVAQYPSVVRNVIDDLLYQARRIEGKEFAKAIDYVIGPSAGAITLADRLADNLQQDDHPRCRSTFTELKDGKLTLRVPLDPGSRVLSCEDTVTTRKSVGDSIETIQSGGGRVLPFVLVVCNRSEHTKVGARRLIPLIHVVMETWIEGACPLCEQGSEAIRPKKDDNWARLNQPY